MKRLLFTLIWLFASCNLFAQLDTIYTSNQQIICSIKEIDGSTIRYSYPQEELVNSLNTNTVQKIVFRSGRTQTFASASHLRNLKSPEDYNLVTVTRIDSEVNGLFKVGEANAKAKGTTEFSGQDKVMERAFRKLKQRAALMGGNVVYIINMKSDGLKSIGAWGATSAETNIMGVVYTNAMANVELFKSDYANLKSLNIAKRYTLANNGSEYKVSTPIMKFNIASVSYDNGFISIKCADNNTTYIVSYINKDSLFVYEIDKSKITSYQLTR